MKHRFLACLAAAVCGTAALTVSAAAEENTDFPELQLVDSLYEDFDPVGNDILAVSGFADSPFSVQIIQHSPERDNLLLYDNDFAAGNDPRYFYRIEPGDYTIRITAEAIIASAVKRTFEYDFTIENADYSAEPELFERTQYGFLLEFETAAGDDPALPVLTNTENSIQVDSKVIIQTVTFGRYARFRGDYDGDGTTDSSDAQQTLIAYLESMIGKGDVANAEQIAACDIDGDGVLTSSDAQQILAFYLEQMVGADPVWRDGIRDVRFDVEPTA